LRDPVHAGRKPGQVASGTHNLVFRNLVLGPRQPGYLPFKPLYRVLFNSYYNAIGDRHPRPERGMLSRPLLEEVLAYRDHVDASGSLELLARRPLPNETAALIELGLQHEQQHQELILTDVKHLFSRNPLKPAYQKQWPLTPIQSRKSEWISVGAGIYEVGHSGPDFCFDNETPRHRVWLDAFRIASQPVTHGDFMEFIETRATAGRNSGFRQDGTWQPRVAGRRRCTGSVETGLGGRSPFTGEAPVDPHTPICHVSFYEADAFARWAHARLPTESEWEAAADHASLAGNFLESGALHPLALREAPGDGMLAQAFGDVWEWTRSDYGPYPGFQCSAGAVGEYNGKFMSGQYVLRGGSCATPSSHIRATYRNFFPPDARWQFSVCALHATPNDAG